MIRARAGAAAVALLLLSQAATGGEGPAPPVFEAAAWTRGPAWGDLAGIARVRVPEGYVFAGAADVERLVEAMEDPATGDEVGLLAPAGFPAGAPAAENWYLLFEFLDVGRVERPEAETLDAEAILAGLREENAAVNEERRRRGWRTLDLSGWAEPPRYDPAGRVLSWALRFSGSDGSPVENHFACLPGRRGVMSVTLGAGPGVAPLAAPRARELLGGFSFRPGQRFEDFEPGDEVFSAGLTGLILGRRPGSAGGLLGRWRLLLMLLVLAAALAAALHWRRRATRSTVARDPGPGSPPTP